MGLALGGGAARGIAHIGVLKGFEDNGIKIDYLAGTSAGSLIAALYSSGLELDDMVEILPKLRWKNFVGFKISRQGIFSSKPLYEFVNNLVGNKTFKQLNIETSILATDILKGEPVIFNQPDMEVATAVRASTSFPGVYSPFEYNGSFLIDGGACANVPAQVVKDMGADIVIAVDVIPKVEVDHVPKHLAVVADRSLDLLLTGVSKKSVDVADLLLSPVTEYIHSFQVKKAKRLYELGQQCVADNLEKIKEIINN